MTPATPDMRHRCASDPLADRVAHACAAEFGVTVEQIYGRGRWEPLVVARQAVMYLLQEDYAVKAYHVERALGMSHPMGWWSHVRVQERLEVNVGNMRERLARIRWALKPQWWVI